MEEKLSKTEVIDKFLNGFNPMEHIISIECSYMDEEVCIIYRNDNGIKKVRKDDFKPFVWAKNSVCVRMFDGDRNMLRTKMKEYGITVQALKTTMDDSKPHERLEGGYKYIFKATKKMTYQRFMKFFKEAGTPIYGDKSKKNECLIDLKENKIKILH